MVLTVNEEIGEREKKNWAKTNTSCCKVTGRAFLLGVCVSATSYRQRSFPTAGFSKKTRFESDQPISNFLVPPSTESHSQIASPYLQQPHDLRCGWIELKHVRPRSVCVRVRDRVCGSACERCARHCRPHGPKVQAHEQRYGWSESTPPPRTGEEMVHKLSISCNFVNRSVLGSKNVLWPSVMWRSHAHR